MDGFILPASVRRRSTSYDVAVLAGVSQSAVSRCFQDGGSVSPGTRRKVQEAARTLGYAPNKIARSLTTQRSRLIAVLVSDITARNFPDLLVRLGLEIQQAAHRMLTFIVPGDEADGALADILAYHVDAVISAVSVPDTMMSACAAQGIPVVVYNRTSRHPWASGVGCDDAAALDRLCEHLRAGGGRRAALLAGPADAPVSTSRIAAAAAAAAAHGLAVTGTFHTDFSYEGGRAAARSVLGGRERPDTVVCANDSSALGVLDACRFDLGLSVPGDVAVAGYDDIPEGARPSYGLTTLSQPVPALTGTALRMARERLDGIAIPGERRLLPAALVVRGSTRAGAVA